MSNFIVDSANIVSFPRPCSLCESKGNVQKFAGLMLCESCQDNIRITNPGMFTNDQNAMLKKEWQIMPKS